MADDSAKGRVMLQKLLQLDLRVYLLVFLSNLLVNIGYAISITTESNAFK